MDSHCGDCGAEFEPEDRFCDQCGARRPGAVVEAGESPRDAASSSAEAGSKRSVVVVATALLAVVPLLLVFLTDCGDVEGSLVVKGGPHGDFTFTPQGCGSLQPYGRTGANLHAGGPHEGGVYVSRDLTRGVKVEIEVPGSCANADGTDCAVFEVPRDACTAYETALDYTGVTVNDVRLVRGHLRMVCDLADGTRVRGGLEFSGC